jgi:hypothetical protein
MKNDHAADLTCERYLVEVDGLMTAEYRIFVKALKASLQLKQEFPNCSVKLREADEQSVAEFMQ